MAEPSSAPVPADRRPTSHQVVAEIMRHRIALGDFPPGSRLPTERELAEVLGVGRNTVRQALRQLTEEGLVSTSLGRSGGTRVRAAADAGHTPRAEILANFRATIRDSIEYRQAIEPFAARLAELPSAPPALESAVGYGRDWHEAVEDIGWTDDDLLAVGSSSVGPLARVFLGSRASKIVRNSPVPVVVLPRR